jgi:hypothetical protein
MLVNLGTVGMVKVSRDGKSRRGLSMGLLIVGIFLAAVGAAMAVTSATMGAPTVPPGTLPEVLSMPALEDPSGLTTAGMISYRDDAYGFDVYFGEEQVDPPIQPGETPFLVSIDGDWYGSDAHLSVDGEERGAAEPVITGSGWGESLPDHAERAIVPSMRAGLPIGASDLHKSIVVEADMVVHVPYRVGDSSFGVAAKRVRRSATLFVVSPEEMGLRRSVDKWNSRGRTGSSGLIALGFGSVLALVGLVLRRRGRSAA